MASQSSPPCKLLCSYFFLLSNSFELFPSDFFVICSISTFWVTSYKQKGERKCRENVDRIICTCITFIGELWHISYITVCTFSASSEGISQQFCCKTWSKKGKFIQKLSQFSCWRPTNIKLYYLFKRMYICFSLIWYILWSKVTNIYPRIVTDSQSSL